MARDYTTEFEQRAYLELSKIEKLEEGFEQDFVLGGDF